MKYRFIIVRYTGYLWKAEIHISEFPQTLKGILMLYSNRALLTLASVLLLLIVTFGMSLADDSPEPAWVDLDGDGFNDLAEDADQDGIPDFGVSHAPATVAGPSQSGIFANMEMPEGASDVTAEPNSLLFDRLSKLTLAQSLTRCDLECAFGGSSGDNSNAAAGGACAGGVCLR
ncbi:MAG TPA: hypothetical protein PLF13_05480 [candidate division Zixibacteria bacterium]|nr:hypothetical protein [candidate division Zixibacteria bacterium]